ncbi:MAG TPA: hypothetical protein PLA71_00090 [Saccharofermentans sp.]|nr:hypothetical protein [Saccharofermentans sp.]
MMKTLDQKIAFMKDLAKILKKHDMVLNPVVDFIGNPWLTAVDASNLNESYQSDGYVFIGDSYISSESLTDRIKEI